MFFIWQDGTIEWIKNPICDYRILLDPPDNSHSIQELHKMQFTFTKIPFDIHV